ncbi:hypothetical protein QJQ45_014291 [Haematococcus lacustris]|nr:hypothetical protein QJQ45_014291 [Haematococcus lacustris]
MDMQEPIPSQEAANESEIEGATGDDSSDEEDSLSTCSYGSSQTDESPGKKKKVPTSDTHCPFSAQMQKKKNKSRRKKPSAADQQPTPSSAGPSKEEKQDADKNTRLTCSYNNFRFNAALAALRGSEEMWIDLSRSLLQDAKAKKLMEQLKANKSVTSLNLSQNQLTDEAAQGIAATLGMSSSAPDLIELDLRENNFTDQGLTILAGLQKLRKQLKIQTGLIQVVEPPVAASGSAKVKAVEADSNGSTGSARDLTKGPLFRKFFQGPRGEQEDEKEVVQLGQEPVEPSIAPGELWCTLVNLSDALGADSEPGSLAALQGPLRQLCSQLKQEVGSLSSSANALDGSRPHVKAAVEHLHVMTRLVAHEPRKVEVQYHPQPQPAVGSHRVWVAEAVALLLESHNTTLDSSLAATELVPRLLHLALHRPLGSALHCRALRLLRASLASQHLPLLQPLFQPGLGCQLRMGKVTEQQEKGEGEREEEGEGEEAEGDKAAAEQALCPPLPELLAARALTAMGVVSGQRSQDIGFVIDACKALASCLDDDDDDPDNPDSDDEAAVAAASAAGGFSYTAEPAATNGKANSAATQQPAGQPGAKGQAGAPGCRSLAVRHLLSSSTWSEFAAAEEKGALRCLCHEQEGDLGGPRILRPYLGGLMHGGSSELADLAGGGLMTGQEILTLLQNMGS